MGAYNRLYKELGGIPLAELDEAGAAAHDPQGAVPTLQQPHDQLAERGRRRPANREVVSGMLVEQEPGRRNA